MPVFAYKALDQSGRTVEGLKEADSPKTLRSVLRRDGIFLNTVGDIHILPLVLDAAEGFAGRPSEEDMRGLESAFAHVAPGADHIGDDING